MASIGYEKHFFLLFAVVSLFCASIHCKDEEESSSFICKDTGNCKDVTPELCKRFPHLKEGCAATCMSCICKDDTNCSDVTNTLCEEHTSIRDQCHKTCGVCKDQVDNLLLIGGWSRNKSYPTIELISIQRKNEICNPHLFDIGYQVEDHSSVLTRNGVITCGGDGQGFDCILQTKNGTRRFPSMNRSRMYFGLALNNDKLFAISGLEAPIGELDTMETIDINGNQWIEVPLPFKTYGHCVVSMNNKIVVMGGGQWSEQGNNSTWLLNTLDNKWTPGPQMNENRMHHSCFQDRQTNSIYVVGGYDNYGQPLATTEKLNMESNKWECASDFPITIAYSAAVASKSKRYIGFVAGGFSEKGTTNKIWGLQRNDHKWIEMPQKLKTRRDKHSMVNLDLDEMPEC